jgi:hypothetical protein
VKPTKATTSIKPIVQGQKFSGVGYDIKVKPEKDQTFLPKKKITQKEAGIKVLAPFDK